jgi:hypothetical protein
MHHYLESDSASFVWDNINLIPCKSGGLQHHYIRVKSVYRWSGIQVSVLCLNRDAVQGRTCSSSQMLHFTNSIRGSSKDCRMSRTFTFTRVCSHAVCVEGMSQYRGLGYARSKEGREGGVQHGGARKQGTVENGATAPHSKLSIVSSLRQLPAT